MEEDTARPKQALVEHLNNIESTRLENRRWAMGGDAMSKEVPTEARLTSPRENDCDLIRCRSKLFTRKLLWKYTLLFLNALQEDPLKSQSSLPSIVLQGFKSLMIQVCCDSDLSLS